MSEVHLLKACLHYLHLKGCKAWENKTGAWKTKTGRLITYGYPGSPDILAILPPHGRLLGVECKMKGNRQQPNQKAFGLDMEAKGALYLVVYSVEALQAALAGVLA